MKHELYYVERLVIEDKGDDQKRNERKLLAEFRNTERYVLLGEPGAGKTTAFKHEAKQLGSAGEVVAAKIFIEWQHNEHEGKTLFIDGLDEVIATSGNRAPLGEVRKQLRKFNIQRYRISCRAADWNGERDKHDFESVNGNIVELQLQGLTEENIKTILRNDHRIKDAVEFFEQAGSNQLGNFLSNPQTLDMLIEATEGGVNWPTSKQALYQKASEVLSKEPNPEHTDSPAAKFLIEELLEAAGELYAYMLITNGQSFNTTETDENSIISLPKLGITKAQPHYVALKTRLFNPVSHNWFNPIHRSIAEFLAAKYLAKKLKQGLSLRRCFALITGFDGGPVAALRGVYAWLGTLSVQARANAIETDVLGLVQYGDVSGYSVTDKLKVIEALKLQATKLGHLNYRDDKGFSGLISEEMLPELKVILSTKDYTNPQQEVLTAILDGLRNSKPQAELKALILGNIKDSKNSHAVRWRALDVFIGFNDIKSLLFLAEAIKTNKIEDNSDELMGQLLKRLFPDYIPASNIFDYLKTVTKSGGLNLYRIFWEYDFLDQLYETDIPQLLDKLAIIEVKHFYYGQHRRLARMVGGLVTRGLQLYGNTVDAERLYTWLGIGLDPEAGDIYGYDSHESKQKIQMWLENNPEAYKKVLKVCLSKLESPEKFGLAFECLWDAKPPTDIWLWWLEQCLEPANSAIKEECFWRAYLAIKSEYGDQGLKEKLEPWLKGHPEFFPTYESLIAPPEYIKKQEERRLKWQEKEAAELKKRLDYFKGHQEALRNGNAPPYALYHLAAACFDHYSNVNGSTGAERLSKFLDGDQELIDAASKGILNTLDRNDLPTEEEVFDLSTKSKIHYLQLPFLTAMEKRYAGNSSFIESISDEMAQRALAFWLSYGAGNQPDWVKGLMLKRPELSSKVLINYMTTMLQKKFANIHGYYQLAHDEEMAEVAKRVVMPVLTKFPTKSLATHAPMLEALLKASIDYINHNELLTLIAQKLKRTSLDIQQRIYLLATGLVIAPETYELKVLQEVTTSERVNHLSGFLYEGGHSSDTPISLKPSTIELLITLIAPLATPPWQHRAGFVTKAMHNGDFAYVLINRLSNNPAQEISQIFDRLLLKEELSGWFLTLKNAKQQYILNRREAEYRPPTPNELAESINQTRPVNVADLSAMVLDFLDRLQRDMHATAFNEYKSYWNDDSYSRLTTPKVENTCAKYLAKQLKDQFSEFDIEVCSESLAPDDKRTDIRVIFHRDGKRLNLPVEIKRNFHDELWTAIHDQLIKLYTIEPDTQGRGIYLVLWFGAEFNVTAKDGGNKPKTAAELQSRLIATMTPEEQKLIDVFVLDVSKPVSL
jgi:hypothetical protein